MDPTNGSQGSKYRFGHVGIAVADLEKAVEFYKVFLQAEPVLFFASNRKQFIDELVGYEANMREALFELQDGYLELLEYTEPKPGVTDPESYNVGHMHFCMEVDDVRAEYERLRDAELGIEFRSDGPILIPDDEPDFKGERYLYLRTPEGATFELFERAPAQ